MAEDLTAVADSVVARGMGLTEQSVQRRQKAVGLTPEDVVRIARIREPIARRAESFANAFLAYLPELDEARNFLQNREAVELSRRLKVDHLIAMVSGKYDVAYAEQRLRLGRRAGLDRVSFLGAFNDLLLDLLLRIGTNIPEAGRQPAAVPSPA